MEEKRFIDRKSELKSILQVLKSKSAELLILYGRRRIGKSRLLHETAKKTKLDLFVMLEETDYQTNLKKAAEAAAARFNFPQFSPKTFKELFSSLPEKTRVVLDEFSYLASSFGEFQAIWEEIARPKKIKLILSGSLIRVMEDLNYSLKSPLYGRATAILKLSPFGVAEVKSWYGESGKIADVLAIYFAVGGIPRYLEIIDKPSLAKIAQAFFSQNGLLLREGKLLLKESFPASVVLPRVLTAVAGGETEAGKIADITGLKNNEVGKYLSLLVDFGYVEKRYPALHANKKQVRFYPADNFLAFWSCFVSEHYSEIDNGRGELAVRKFTRDFNTFCGFQFEKAVIQAILKNPQILPFEFEFLGNQWGKTNTGVYEIDILAGNSKTNQILFGECKWQNQANALKIVKNLAPKNQFVKWHEKKRQEYFAIFAKSFKNKIKEFEGKRVICLDLPTIWS